MMPSVTIVKNDPWTGPRLSGIMNRKPFSVALLGMFVLQSCGLATGIQYKLKPLQSHRLAIVETDVEKVRSKVLEVFENNGVELELYFSDNALFSDGFRMHSDTYYYHTGRFKVGVWADYGNYLPFPQLRIAVYPAVLQSTRRVLAQ